MDGIAENSVSFGIVLKRIRIERFKSINKLSLDLAPGVNVLVGPNASGKSNILEALSFFRKALIDEAARIPYHPTREYWSPEDIFYMKDTSKPIVIGVDGELIFENLPIKGSITMLNTELTTFFDALRQTVMPTRIEIKLGESTKIAVETGRLELIIEKSAMAYPFVRKQINKLVENKILEDDGVKYIARRDTDIRPPVLIRDLLLAVDRMILFIHKGECRQYRRKILACIFTPIESFAKIALREQKEPLLTVPVIAKITKLNRQRALSTRLRRYTDVHDPAWVLKPVNIIRLLADRFLPKIIMVKHPDTGRVREPTPLSVVGEPLNERATNLPAVLFTLREAHGSIPEIIENSVRRFFPDTTLSLRTQYGRVALTALEGKLELTPRNLSDGLIKLVTLMTAASLNPALLLIDEIENSMHYEMQEYVIHTLNALGIPTIVATHSPFVVDLVGPERTIILSKELGGPTRAERVSDAEELKKRLTELGISFSDYVFYERTRTGKN